MRFSLATTPPWPGTPADRHQSLLAETHSAAGLPFSTPARAGG